MDDGFGGPYVTKVGVNSPYMMSTFTTLNIVRGRTYRFRYRVRNCVGWGPFSPELFALAASVPAAPPSPTKVSVSASAITLQLYPTKDNGGSVITDYELWYKLTTSNSNYV